MKKLFTMTFAAALALASVSHLHAGACDPQSEVGGTRKVSAATPAHLNPVESDKVTGTVPARAEVQINATREVDGQTWYLVAFTDGDKKAGWIKGSAIICD